MIRKLNVFFLYLGAITNGIIYLVLKFLKKIKVITDLAD